MKTACPLLALTALLAVSGCSDSDEPCFTPPPSGTAPFGLPAQPVDSPTSLEVFALTNLSCGDPSAAQVPDSVTAQVLDPENRLLPSEVSLRPGGLSATVHFTPRMTGRHHVLVAFAPVGSVQQLGTYVTRPWSGTGGPVTLPLPRCTQLDRTSRGTWICDGVALREPGARPVRFSTSSVAPDVTVAGNVVWVVGEGKVRRFVDTGTELALTGSLLTSPEEPVKVIQSRLATENELLVLDNLFLHRFTFTDTGVLDAAGATVWTDGGPKSFGVDGAMGLLVRMAEDRVRVVWMDETLDSQACPFQRGPDGVYTAASEPCQPLSGRPVGYAEGLVWTRSGDALTRRQGQGQGQTLHLWRAREGTLVEEGTLVLDAPVESLLSPLRVGFLVPSIRLGTSAMWPVMTPGQGSLGLESLPGTASLPLELRTVSPRFYWEGDSRQSNGSTVVFERGPLP
jgi:hypothetical protein